MSLQVLDLAFALESMGVTVLGTGTHHITVHPASNLRGLDWTIIPDRVEAGTYLEAAAITGSCLTVTPCIPEHMAPLLSLLRQIGCTLELCAAIFSASHVKSSK
jgi:UDP-N-acetylglucosamine 1-carboxyvinyltransferase